MKAHCKKQEFPSRYLREGRGFLLYCTKWAATGATAAALFGIHAGSLHAFEIRDVDPVSGPVSTVVSVSGSGFDPQGAYTVSINGKPATVSGVTTSSLEILVPPGASSGLIRISDGNLERSALEPFVVTRQIEGRLVLPTGLAHQGYKVIGYQSVVEPVSISAGEASFTIELPLDQPSVVWAIRTESDPPFLAVVTSEDEEPAIDAESTAVALALINPGIAATRDLRARKIKEFVAEDNLATDLASFLEDHAASGANYFDDSRYQDKLLVLIQNILLKEAEEPVLMIAAIDPQFPSNNTLIKPLNREYLLSELTTQLVLTEPTEFRPNFYLLEVKVGSRFSSVDWIIEVFRLRTLSFDFPNGMQDVRALTYEHTPVFASTVPVREGLLAAQLDTARVDYIGSLVKAIVSFAEGGVTNPERLKPNQLLLPTDDAIYIVQAYSGNIFWRYGGQEYILDHHDPNNSWLIALGGNTFIAVVDLSAMFIDFKKLTGTDDLGFVTAQVKALNKALAASLVDGELSMVDYMNLVGLTMKTFVSHALSKILDKAVDEGIFFTFQSVVGNAIRSGFDVFKKLSSGLQIVERTGGLLLPGRLAVERSVVVVGDPFPPVISSITPLSARKGDTISITGRNFPAGAEGEVWFCTFDPEAPPGAFPEIQLSADVLTRSAHTLVVTVPPEFESVFSDDDVIYLCVVDGAKRGDSQALGTRGIFNYIPLPIVDTARPNPQIPGGPLTLEGRYFFPGGTDEYEVMIDGIASGVPSRVGENSVSLLLPVDIEPGLHDVGLMFRGEPTISTSIEVVEPPENVGDLTQGVTIFVTVADWSNNRDDGEISLLEALLIANGELPVSSLQHHLPCELLPADDPNKCPRQTREIDWISGVEEGAGGGFLAADTIVLHPRIADQIIFPGSTMPSPGPGDTIIAGSSFPGGSTPITVYVDGQNLPAGSPAFHLEDLFGVTIGDLRFRNIPGDAIRITGGGEHELRRLMIENSGGSGVVLDGTAHNSIASLGVSDAGGHGIRLTGGASNNTLQASTISGAALSGILLEGEAEENRIFNIISEQNGLHGVHLSGSGVQRNRLHGGGQFEIIIRGLDIYRECGGYGILIDGGARENTICPLMVTKNGLGGMALKDMGTADNHVGWQFTRGFPNTQHTRAYDNGGPGVYLGPGAQRNTINHVTSAGNNGDGFLLEGPDCSFNEIGAVWTGFDIFAAGGAVPLANQGNGMRLRSGASDNVIGSRLYQATYSHRSFFANNELNGILIEGEGSDRNLVIRADLGYTLPARYYFGNQAVYKSNGLDGIAMRDGARENVIGDESFYLDLHIFASGGAGIRISGEGTDNNLVMNCHLGRIHTNIVLEAEQKNRFGIVLENGAKRNMIGALGARRSIPQFPFTLEFGNTIVNSLEAGIVLNNCGGLIGPDGTPGEANIIQNNTVGVHTSSSSGNPVGILITGNARGNIVGGFHPGAGNGISANEKAGIQIHNNSVFDPRERTLIVGNTITRGGVTVTDPAPLSLLDGPPHGVGFLVSGNSSGNVLGETFIAPNAITINVCGIYLDGDGVADTLVQGNQITSFNTQPAGGVVVRGGTGAIIGGSGFDQRNLFRGNGTANDPLAGGILLAGGNSHTIQNNQMENHPGHAIILHGAAQCVIGGPDRSQANVIVNSGGHGILLGASSNNNVIRNNYVGVSRTQATGLGNQGSGIAILGESDNNVIGGALAWSGSSLGTEAAFGNVIASNARHGVLVDDSSGNSILYNSIYSNALNGIELAAGGNDEMVPPILTFSGSTITGTVLNTIATPPGSRIQIFSDTGGQGETYLGEAEVGPDGHWSFSGISLIPFGNLTATATHSATGSTSSFGSGFAVVSVSAFQLRREDGELPSRRLLAADATQTEVHRIEAATGDFAVRLRSLTVRAGGDFPESTAVTSVMLALDANGNGVFDEGDRVISPPAFFAEESDDVTLHPIDLVVPENAVRKLLVIYEFNQPVPANVPFDLRILNAAAVVAETVLPVNNRVAPLAQFPIESDLLEFILASGGFADWQALHFSDAELQDELISGPRADPEGDGIVNALEYAFGLNPRMVDVSGTPRLYRNDEQRLAYDYQRRKPGLGLSFDLWFTRELDTWFNDNRVVEQIEILELSEEIERVTVILNEDALRLFVKLEVHIDDQP